MAISITFRFAPRQVQTTSSIAMFPVGTGIDQGFFVEVHQADEVPESARWTLIGLHRVARCAENSSFPYHPAVRASAAGGRCRVLVHARKSSCRRLLQSTAAASCPWLNSCRVALPGNTAGMIASSAFIMIPATGDGGTVVCSRYRTSGCVNNDLDRRTLVDRRSGHLFRGRWNWRAASATDCHGQGVGEQGLANVGNRYFGAPGRSRPNARRNLSDTRVETPRTTSCTTTFKRDPKIPCMGMQPFLAALAALEQRSQSVQEQALAEPSGTGQEAEASLVRQLPDSRGLVDIMEALLPDGAELLDPDRQAAAHQPLLQGSPESPCGAGPPYQGTVAHAMPARSVTLHFPGRRGTARCPKDASRVSVSAASRSGGNSAANRAVWGRACSLTVVGFAGKDRQASDRVLPDRRPNAADLAFRLPLNMHAGPPRITRPFPFSVPGLWLRLGAAGHVGLQQHAREKPDHGFKRVQRQHVGHILVRSHDHQAALGAVQVAAIKKVKARIGAVHLLGIGKVVAPLHGVLKRRTRQGDRRRGMERVHPQDWRDHADHRKRMGRAVKCGRASIRDYLIGLVLHHGEGHDPALAETADSIRA